MKLNCKAFSLFCVLTRRNAMLLHLNTTTLITSVSDIKSVQLKKQWSLLIY